MRKVVMASLAVALVVVACNALSAVFAQGRRGQGPVGMRTSPLDTATMLAGFSITVTVEPRRERLAIGCETGCAWPAPLIFGAGAQAMRVNELGVVPRGSDKPRRGRFIIRIERLKSGGLTASCEKGCAWKTQPLDCPAAASCRFRFNEYGGSRIESRGQEGAGLLATRKTVAASMAREKRPDFSGRWILAPGIASASNVPAALTVRQSLEPPFRILRVDRRFANGLRSDTYRVGPEGGTAAGGVDASGRGTGPNGEPTTTRFSTRWEGDRLVMENGRHSGRTRESGPYTEHAEVWWLEGGRLHITITDRSSGGDPTTASAVYRRR